MAAFFRAGLAAAFTTGGLIAAAGAQVPPTPDAGRLLETVKPPLSAPAAPHAPIVVPAVAVPGESQDEGPTFVVRRFHIEGATLFPAERLGALLADLAGRPATLGGIRQGVERITRLYHDAGYFVARAYLPPQTIEQGEVRVTVLEGRIGEVKVADIPGDEGGRLKLRMAATLQAQGVVHDAPIARPSLERGVLLLEDLVGADVKASLRPGASLGAGDLNLETRGKAPVSGSLGLDNYGSRYSGAWRANGGVNFAHPFRAGDALGLRLTHGQGLDYLLAAYQVPVGYNGLRFGFNASTLRYSLCCGAPGIGSKGVATTFATTASYPWLLSQDRTLTFSGGLERKALKDDASTGNTNDKRLDLANVGLSGLLASGALVQRGEATLTGGRLDLSRNAASRALDAASARTQGNYAKLRLGYSARYAVSQDNILQLRLSGQWTGKNLDSSEKMSLGGIDGVRAYPTGEASGDEGLLARLEWARPLRQETLPGQFAYSAFFDAGHIRLNADPWPAAAATRNAYELYGAGLGLTWSAPGGLSAVAAVATPIGDNPGQVNGRDSDGRSARERLWLMLNLPL